MKQRINILKKVLIKTGQYTAKELRGEIFEEISYAPNTFEVAGREYMVLKDKEADEKAAENIKESLWAFNISFMSSYFSFDVTREMEKQFQEMQGKMCESCNDMFLRMVGDRLDELTSDAIACDGRAHFLNTYDDCEEGYCDEKTKKTEWFVYRIS